MRDAKKKRKKNNDDMTCAARAHWQNSAMALKFSFSILILILADGKQTAADAHLCWIVKSQIACDKWFAQKAQSASAAAANG